MKKVLETCRTIPSYVSVLVRIVWSIIEAFILYHYIAQRNAWEIYTENLRKARNSNLGGSYIHSMVH